MMTPEQDKVIRRLIAEHFACPVIEVTDDKAFVDDLGADSLDGVEIALRIEETFDIEVNDDVLDGITRVGDLMREVGKVLP